MSKSQTADFGSYDNNLADYATRQAYDIADADQGAPTYGEDAPLGNIDRPGWGQAANPDWGDFTPTEEEEAIVHENFFNRVDTAVSSVLDGLVGSMFDVEQELADDIRSARVLNALESREEWLNSVVNQRILSGITVEDSAAILNNVLDAIREAPLNDGVPEWRDLLRDEVRNHAVVTESWVLEGRVIGTIDDLNNWWDGFELDMHRGPLIDLYQDNPQVDPAPDLPLSYGYLPNPL